MGLHMTIREIAVGKVECFDPYPPPGWEEAIRYPMQSARVAEAFRTMGYVPYYMRDGSQTALVQIRDPIGRGGSPLARASIYPANEDRGFITRIVEELRQRGVGFIRVGNTMWGSATPDSLAFKGAKTIERHTFRLDLRLSERELFRNMVARERQIRKAKKSGVQVEVCESSLQLEAYSSMVRETNMRIRDNGGAIAVFPPSFYRELLGTHHSSVCGTDILLLVAYYRGRIIAGNLFLVHGDTMLAYQAAFYHDPLLAPLQAPIACLWAGIEIAKSRGLSVFDLGGHTPDLPSSDSRYGIYQYKKQWGGEDYTFYNAEIIVSPFRYRLQESVGRFLWNSLHPTYFKMRKWVARSTPPT